MKAKIILILAVVSIIVLPVVGIAQNDCPVGFDPDDTKWGLYREVGVEKGGQMLFMRSFFYTTDPLFPLRAEAERVSSDCAAFIFLYEIDGKETRIRAAVRSSESVVYYLITADNEWKSGDDIKEKYDCVSDLCTIKFVLLRDGKRIYERTISYVPLYRNFNFPEQR